MASKETETSDITSKVNDTVEKMGKSLEDVLERLAENQNRILEAAGTARDRSRRVTDEYLKSVADAQREAIEVTKTLAAQPTAYGKNMEALLESATNAQARAMEMTKLFYREQAEATSEFQQLVQPLFESTKGFSEITKNFQSFLKKSA